MTVQISSWVDIGCQISLDSLMIEDSDSIDEWACIVYLYCDFYEVTVPVDNHV